MSPVRTWSFAQKVLLEIIKLFFMLNFLEINKIKLGKNDARVISKDYETLKLSINI